MMSQLLIQLWALPDKKGVRAKHTASSAVLKSMSSISRVHVFLAINHRLGHLWLGVCIARGFANTVLLPVGFTGLPFDELLKRHDLPLKCGVELGILPCHVEEAWKNQECGSTRGCTIVQDTKHECDVDEQALLYLSQCGDPENSTEVTLGRLCKDEEVAIDHFGNQEIDKCHHGDERAQAA